MMLSDRLLFAAMVILPILITIAAGYALRYEKLNVIPVAAVDEDRSANSGLLLDRLSHKEGIGLFVEDRKKAMSMLEHGKVEQVFVVRKGFSESVAKGEGKGLIELYSAPSSYSAGFTREIVSGETVRLIMANMAANDVESLYGKLGIRKDAAFREDVTAYAESLWEPKPLMTIDYKEWKAGIVMKRDVSVLPASSASSAGLVTAFVMFYMLFGSGWLIEERCNGTIKRLGSGTGALAASFWGGVLALFLAGAMQILLFGVIQGVFFGISLVSGPLSFLVLASYLLAVIAIGMFLSSVLRTQAQLQAGAPVLALFTGFAGGCFWNFVAMPEHIAKLALFTPQGWALRGIDSLLANPSDFAAAAGPVLVLLSIALIFMPAGYIIINMQLRR